ncbi:hypothetical protein NE237_029971 [Protea cynaroides]|uniref:Fe2OG dioxygenase domain-containing protein n=1 Tax=Protea cynaroides TaxID=273540 RepID=A0A9Q0GWW7_9MAGN|nr:hypothetical protein NE237_029971 [Protea cynaroides]
MSEQKQDLSSYPPFFFQQSESVRTVEPKDSIPPISDEPDPLPCIDLQHLNPEEIGKACRNWGMFRLVNHGIPIELGTQLQEQLMKVFSLPFEDKQAGLQSPITYFWGTAALTPSGVALREKVQKVNRIEGIYARLHLLPQMTTDDPMFISFRNLLEEYGKHMAELIRCLFEALRKNLGIDPALSKPYLSEYHGLFRLYRYFPCSESSKEEGISAHTDSTVLSIVNQDQVGGLQVFKDDRWIEIRPIPNTLVVNIGDMFQAMSNDEYKSAEHRVLNKQEARISICYFVHPEDDVVIQSTKYKPFTYKDFRAQVQEDIKTIGTKVGLQRFKPT